MEISLIIVILRFVILSGGYCFKHFGFNQKDLLNIFIFFPLIIIWFRSSLAETNRSPFDFSEGESELVSGFNTEYGSGIFALIFIAEYGRILFISYLICIIFFCGYNFFRGILGLMISFFILWIRGCLPRYRYDFLILMAWKVFLPLRLFYILNVYFFIYFSLN